MAKRRSNHNFRAEGFTPVANSAWAEANREIARGNAASKHVVKSRKGTRSSKMKRELATY